MPNSCATCKYFDAGHPEVSEDGVGECVRYPPKIVVQTEFTYWGMFPAVVPSDWCGEWRNPNDGVPA